AAALCSWQCVKAPSACAHDQGTRSERFLSTRGRLLCAALRGRPGTVVSASNSLSTRPSEGQQPQVERRARCILGLRIKFIPHPCFNDPSMRAEIVGPVPGGKRARIVSVRVANFRIPILKADCEEFPLLTPEQELHLFRKMNFLYHQAFEIQRTI